MSANIKIADFAGGGRIPSKFTCAAGPTSLSPAITWSGMNGKALSKGVYIGIFGQK